MEEAWYTWRGHGEVELSRAVRAQLDPGSGVQRVIEVSGTSDLAHAGFSMMPQQGHVIASEVPIESVVIAEQFLAGWNSDNESAQFWEGGSKTGHEGDGVLQMFDHIEQC